MGCKAAHLDLTNARSRNQLLGLYERQGRNREALRTGEELIGIEPENGNYWLIVGELNRRLGRKVQARDAVERALRIDPDNPRYHEVYQLVQEGD